MNVQIAQHICQTVASLFNQAAQQNPMTLLMVAGFIVCNIGLYLVTRGKEFAISGYAAALFLIPFLM